MTSFILHLTFLSTVFMATHAAGAGHVASEVYWESVLHKTLMPNAIKSLLHPPEWTNMVVGHGKPVNVAVSKTVEVTFKYGKPRRTNNQPDNHPNAKPVNVAVSKTVEVSLKYGKPRRTSDQILKDNPKIASIFFLEKNMRRGAKMNVYLPIISSPLATFLPKEISTKIPFSSNKFSDILNIFSIKPDSEEAKIMKNTIDDCEEVGIKGEEKYCATDLESMIDFSTSKLGNKVKAISTDQTKGVSKELDKYTIVGVKNLGGGVDKAVACHKEDYAYAVFYCHKIEKIKVLMVSLSGENGAKVNAVAVCHKDTRAWDTKYLGFKVLNVGKGTVPVCHFLPQESRSCYLGSLLASYLAGFIKILSILD